jgi:hypothetical protein
MKLKIGFQRCLQYREGEAKSVFKNLKNSLIEIYKRLEKQGSTH